MRRALCLLLLALAGGCSGPVVAEKLLDASDLDGQAPVGLTVADGTVVVRTATNLYDVRARRFLLARSDSEIQVACATQDGLVFVRDGALRTVDGQSLLELPLRDVRLASSGTRLFIAGVDAGEQATVYLFDRERGHQPLLDLPAGVDALAVAREWTYLTIGPLVYRFKPGGRLTAEAALPGLERIVSIAVDAEHEILYVSDGRALYALLPRKARTVLIFRDAGGLLGFDDGCLYLLSLARGELYRIERLAEALTADAPPLITLK